VRNGIILGRNSGAYMQNALLSVEQAAQRLGGVSRWSIYSWLSQGRLRKTKVGSRVMIREADLEAFVAACNSETETPAQRKAGA
jgi:excisionase family DNA binding protein